MSGKTKSKAARRFGIKQTIQNLIIQVILFLILVAIFQLAFHYYTGARWIAVGGAEEITEELLEAVENTGKEVGADLTAERIDAMIVRNVRKRASINFPENGSIRWDLVYMGTFKDSGENAVDRFELRFKYPLQVKLLNAMTLRGNFRGKSSFKTKRNGPLRPLATANETES